MVHNLGPTGKYPLGVPYDQSDQGHMHIAFAIEPPRHAKMTFGTLLDWFFVTPESAGILVATIRSMIAAAYGGVRPSEVPLLVVADNARGVVTVDLPNVTSELVATAEVWLALADRLEEECRKLQ